MTRLTPPIAFPDYLTERQTDKIKNQLWKLDESIIITIVGGRSYFQYDFESLIVKIAPEMKEGNFPNFLLAQHI
jgi:hypothetical protein